MQNHQDLCIYTTGSYGRLEACEFSDIDLFFLYDNNKEKEFPKIDKILIDSGIIKICREMNFPEFSSDGEYLQIHNVNNFYDELGSRKDDHCNYFTARMLLLLEGRFIYNKNLYEKIIDTTINKYYKDFHGHEKDFKPVFLVNDVIRFWRTMCLNYEHSRNRKSDASTKVSDYELNLKKNKAHIKNLKLRFSRKLICYSFLLSVLYSAEILDEKSIKSIISLTPLDRLKKLTEMGKVKKEDIDLLIEHYSWFLEKMQVENQALLEWVSIQKNRDEAFGKSREFAKKIFKIMMNVDNSDNLLYFLI
ncbi:MAG TPA: nucleotidyltransferase domain-containing protein [Ignavibacteria bacterium]|nr:nucleotidyltransferase domain-containing protein [Ignavibacteria bacterium]